MIREDVLTRAKSGDSESQAIAAYFYYKDGDFANALTWAQNAAEQGNSKGFYLLGIMYWNGLGTEKDVSVATAYLRRAAALNNADAIKVLQQKGIALTDEANTETAENADSENQETAETVNEEDEAVINSEENAQPDAKSADGEESEKNEALVDENSEKPEKAIVDEVDAVSDEQEKEAEKEEVDERQPLTPERLKELKALAKAESEKLKRKKMRKRIDRRKRGLKVFGKIMIGVAILLAVVVVFFAAIYFIPSSGPRSAWNKFCTSIWFSDTAGVKQSMYFPTSTAEDKFDEQYSNGAYFNTFPFAFGLMMPADVSEDGNTAQATAYVFYIYKSDTYSGGQLFHTIKLDFVKTEEGNWLLENEYPLPRLG